MNILTGDRPTGRLHLGHYIGSLENRLALQDEHRMFILVADMQALTDNMDDPQRIKRHVSEVVKDYLSVGIDPGKSIICLQSKIPALSEITQYLLNLVTVARLGQNPTVKAEIRHKQLRHIPAGFYTYPVSQAADICAFDAHCVPVGEDQLPMLEQAQELVSRFNSLYGETLVMPKALVSPVGRLPGTDGKHKMSKSLGNAIYLSDSPEQVRAKVRQMYTDPNHLRVQDPGRVEGNPVFAYLDAFDRDKQRVEDLKAHYRKGGLGDVQVKNHLAEVLNELLEPIRERRAALGHDAMEILKQGSGQAAEYAQKTLERMKEAMGIDYF